MARTKARLDSMRRHKEARRRRRKRKKPAGPGATRAQNVVFADARLGVPKMSAVLWDFAMPILEPLAERELIDVTARIHLASLAWNTTLLEQEAGTTEPWDTMCQEIRALSDFDVEQALPLLDLLRHRKNESFAADGRCVLDVCVSEPSKDSFHLIATSAPPLT